MAEKTSKKSAKKTISPAVPKAPAKPKSATWRNSPRLTDSEIELRRKKFQDAMKSSEGYFKDLA